MARILIAEDEEGLRGFLQIALEKAGHSVTACSDGIQAWEAIEISGDYDLLLTDIVMPGMDGIELSRKAARLYPALKIMFITGFTGVAAATARQHDSPVLAKPFHLKELVEQVDRLLGD